MRTATEEDLTWILQAILDFGLILEPEAIVTDADKAMAKLCVMCSLMFPIFFATGIFRKMCENTMKGLSLPRKKLRMLH